MARVTSGPVRGLALAAVVISAAGVVAASVVAPTAAASAVAFCDRIGGQWDGRYCSAAVVSDRNAVREINIVVPPEIDDPLMGGVLSEYLSALMTNWRDVGQRMAADSWGNANLQVFSHGSLRSLVFHEDYHADGTAINDAYRTFTFDLAAGRQVQLADLLTPGTPLTAIPPLAAPFIQAALDAAPPPHPPNTYPFVADRWTPDNVYSGGYRAWALDAGALILYLPDYPVGRDSPVDFSPSARQWSMNGGMVQPRIPLSVLAPILRAGI